MLGTLDSAARSFDQDARITDHTEIVVVCDLEIGMHGRTAKQQETRSVSSSVDFILLDISRCVSGNPNGMPLEIC